MGLVEYTNANEQKANTEYLVLDNAKVEYTNK